MRTRRTILPALLGTMVLATACVAQAQNSENLLPLAVGNAWQYELTSSRRSRVDTSVQTIAIDRDTVMGGIRMYRVPLGNDGAWFGNGVGGVYAWGRELGPDPVLFFRYPLAKGESYEFHTGGPTFTIAVVAVDEVVELPSGSARCIHYRMRSDKDEEAHVLIDPRIGVVKFGSGSIDQSSRRSEGGVLKSFTLQETR
jgi:hypothetical protein